MNRYSPIEGNFPREFILLQGTGCKWKRCTFCDYFHDTSDNPFSVNEPVLRQVTGKFGVLDIINSGSACELDADTIALIQDVVRTKGIHTLWLEMHYMYRNRLQNFATLFHPAKVKFRCGVETFDPALRQTWNKGIPMDATPEDISKHFQGVCLLCCTDSIEDTKQRLLRDIELSEQYFEYYSVNLFTPNATSIQRNHEMVQWFKKDVMPKLKLSNKAEVLIDNDDLGVG